MQPADRVVRQVFAEVVALFRGFRRMDVGRVAHQVRLVLRRLAGQEAVEIFEAEIRRPFLERPGLGGLFGRCVVPFAPGGGGVAVILEHLGDQGAASWNLSGIAVPVIGELRDLPVTDPVVIAAGQQRRPGRRAHGRCVESIVGNPFLDDAVHRRGFNLASERRRKAGARVVDENDQNVRRVGRKPARRRPLLTDRLLHRAPSNAGRGRRREGKGLLLFRFVLRVSHPFSPSLCERGRCAQSARMITPANPHRSQPQVNLSTHRKTRTAIPTSRWRR